MEITIPYSSSDDSPGDSKVRNSNRQFCPFSHPVNKITHFVPRPWRMTNVLRPIIFVLAYDSLPTRNKGRS